MKLLLIKIGKAWHTLRREGIVHGMKRIVPAGLSLFRRVPAADVLFITGGVGDSARFRTAHVSEELGLNGITSSVTVQDNPFLPSYADRFSVFVFHRVLFTPSVAKLVDEIRKRGKEIVFETDDLVYDPEFLRHMDYWRVMNPLERKLYESGVGGEILADPYVRVATTSTSFLADRLREKGKRVFLVPNRLSEEDAASAEALLSASPPADDGNVVIGYFSGAAGHDKDFGTVTGPLLRLLDRYPSVRLLIVGPLTLDDRFARFSDRIDRRHYAPRKEHFENILSTDINIAPLEIGNPFCEGKSELKFFEAGILGVPTVAAATRTFREAITDGEDGFVATDAEEWEEKLGRLIGDADLRRRIGKRARETARSRYLTTSADNREYYDFLSARISGEGGVEKP